MTTFVGMQKNFHEALFALCELDYDAIEAYEAAINRLNDPTFKSQLAEFKADHQQHVAGIRRLLNDHNEAFPEGPCPKQLLTQGKVVLAELMGDQAILRAMLSNEQDTNDAYEKMNTHEGMWPDAVGLLEKGAADEKRHKAWLEKTLDAL